MPKPRERDPSDQLKEKSGGRPKRDIHRQMTAKLRKELVEKNRAGGEAPAEAQAVDQVEQASTAALEEVSWEAGDLIDRAARPDRRPRERTDSVKGDGHRPREPGQGPGTVSPRNARRGTHPAGQPERARESGPGVKTQAGAADAAPASLSSVERTDPPASTPQARMKQQAAQELEWANCSGKPLYGHEAPSASPHYGSSLPKGHTPKGPISSENQSIYPSNQSVNRSSIKERPRRSAAPREKPPGGAFTPKTRQRVEQAARKGTAAGKSALQEAGRPAGKQIMERARRKAQAAAQKSMAQRAKQAAKAAAGLSQKAALGIARAVAAMVSALASLVGGAVLVLALAVVLLIGALLASPFGILFSNEPSPEAVPLNAAVAQINGELSDRLEELQAGEYDSVALQGRPPDWREVAAVFAAKTAGAEEGTDVAALTPDKVELLRTVFWDMCGLSAQVVPIEHPASGEDEAWTEDRLVLTITPKTAEEMRTVYALTEFQEQALSELLAELDALGGLLTDLTISQADAREVLQSLPAELAPERRATVEAALSLVGKVNYFWGGKSSAIGWDDRWGTLQKVTAAGSSTTGTYRPFGLDCTGFLDWAFRNAGLPSDRHWYIGVNLEAVSQAEALPGDIALNADASHVGMVVGRTENGEILVCHCSSGQNNVVITEFADSGFTVIGRLL